MMDISGISRDQLPDLYESYEAVGTLKPELAEALGLSAEVKIDAEPEIMQQRQWVRNGRG